MKDIQPGLVTFYQWR